MSALNCPLCQNPMQEDVRHGVTIDTCPRCRGVWLDRGELEKIAAAIGGVAPMPQQPMPPQGYAQPMPPQGYAQPGYPPQAPYPPQGYHPGYGRGYHQHKHSKYYKKSGMRSLLDFFD